MSTLDKTVKHKSMKPQFVTTMRSVGATDLDALINAAVEIAKSCKINVGIDHRGLEAQVHPDSSPQDIAIICNLVSSLKERRRAVRETEEFRPDATPDDTPDDYKKRLIREQEELFDRLEKLHYFIQDSDVYLKLPTEEKVRLQKQEDLMGKLNAVLEARIRAFEDPE